MEEQQVVEARELGYIDADGNWVWRPALPKLATEERLEALELQVDEMQRTIDNLAFMVRQALAGR